MADLTSFDEDGYQTQSSTEDEDYVVSQELITDVSQLEPVAGDFHRGDSLFHSNDTETAAVATAAAATEATDTPATATATAATAAATTEATDTPATSTTAMAAPTTAAPNTVATDTAAADTSTAATTMDSHTMSVRPADCDDDNEALNYWQFDSQTQVPTFNDALLIEDLMMADLPLSQRSVTPSPLPSVPLRRASDATVIDHVRAATAPPVPPAAALEIAKRSLSASAATDDLKTDESVGNTQPAPGFSLEISRLFLI